MRIIAQLIIVREDLDLDLDLYIPLYEKKKKINWSLNIHITKFSQLEN